MSRPVQIPVFCLDWHISQSPAMKELLIKPLTPYIDFKQIGWAGTTLPNFQFEWLRSRPIVFFQLPPPENIFGARDARIIWIPMWDQARGYNKKWWDHLPKNLKVISFSNEISCRARAVGLKTLDLKFAKPPNECEQADWSGRRTLFYWNRTGIVGEAFLRKLCKVLDVEELLFRRRIDPGQAPRSDYELPQKLGKTIVKELIFDALDAHREYLFYLNQANIFIAPRISEGVGLSFIEALTRGVAVFAYNAPTMNEYIVHKINGYLLQQSYKSAFNTMQKQLTMQLRRLGSRFGYERPSFEYPITEMQNWNEIKKLDLQALGIEARQSQHEDYLTWENSLTHYASFILDW